MSRYVCALRRVFSCLLFSLIACFGFDRAGAADPIKLNGPLVSGGNVATAGLQFSPDSSLVLYSADQETDNIDEAFTVPSTGGASIKLNGTLTPGGNVSPVSLQFSPDSSRVLYLADQDTDSVSEIYSVSSAGGAAVKLNGALVGGGDVSFGALFSPDSSRVVYHANQQNASVSELYSVSSAGGSAVKLNGSLVAGGSVAGFGFQFSSDSSRVLYAANQDNISVFELFSVASTGGAAVKLNGPLATGGDVSAAANGWKFSPDGSHVLYLADQDINNVDEIYSVPSAGGMPVKLNGALVPGGDVSPSGLQFSPDGSLVLYLADQEVNNVTELYAVESAGGTAVKLNGPITTGGNVINSNENLQFSPDSSRVFYRADQDTDGVGEIYSVSSTGGAATKLNGPLVTGGDINVMQVSPDSARVLYRGDQETDGVQEIFTVPSTGGTAVKLNGPLADGGDVVQEHFSPDSSRVLYYADQEVNDVFEIYLVPTNGGTPTKLNAPLVPGGDVFTTGLQFSPDGSLVLYQADQDTDEVVEIYTRIVRQHSLPGAGNWDAGAAWDHGGTPDEVMRVLVDGAGTVTASGIGTRSVNELVIGGGTGASALALTSGAGITTLHGTRIKTGGVLRGDGVLVSDLTIDAGGELRAGPGEHLMLASADTVSNSGRIEAIGTTNAPAEIEFQGTLVNAPNTGLIVARNGTLRFNGDLSNLGSLAVSFGNTDIFGNVNNITFPPTSSVGNIVIGGNSNVTFYDDVANNAVLNVASGSTAVFLGALSGNGNVGSGDIQALGDLQPGFSPGAMEFGGDLSLGQLSNLEIEIGGLTPGIEFDLVDIAGEAALTGDLEVSLIHGFEPSAGDTFEILTADEGVNGTFFSTILPTLTGNLDWQINYGTNNIVLEILAVLAADTEPDGDVDGFDFLSLQRDNPGLIPTWQTEYGSSPAVAASNSVPEPRTWLLLSVLTTVFSGHRCLAGRV
ncbi:hypothetical protein [Adhaeretor mobilis]|uniref:Translocation protein TolB n=1 Tax=Adhaeretor mobilis TaxID=1930276 RepID=A0A517N366_9BACT|nr:hypothetical protein [Adhaeretor mobilis]QDT01582.1 translocation protein TolB [Adhaeretor mobilis]